MAIQFKLPIKWEDEVDGWPVRSWIHRRYYPTAGEAIADAQRAIRQYAELFVVKHTGGPPQYWEGGIYWTILEKPPFHGQAGSYYYPLPEHYIVSWCQALHIPEEIKRKGRR